MNEKYIASIITPFHNTNLKFFKNAFDSVVNQTAGIDNIEWVIVVHNSEDEYYQGVLEMTKDYESIKVFNIHNEHRTASSPRNYALDKVTGKYLFFLDSDDHMTLNCVHDVSSKLEETGATIAKFRSVEEHEDEDVIELVDHRGRFDQTKDVILLHREDRDLKNVISISYMTPWCQAIRRDFIEEHHIRYDLGYATGEDVLFTIELMRYMDSLIILPQTIGYVYYVNHASTMQQMGAPTVESITGLAMGVKTQMESGLKAGLDMRYLFWEFSHSIAEMMLGTPQLSKSDRSHIGEILGDFFDEIEPLDADGKFFTEESATEWMEFTRSILCGEEGVNVNHRAMKEVIEIILDDNKMTDFGRRYGFNLIHNKQAFSEVIPVTDYDFYAPIINLMIKIKESNIITSDTIKGYALTSGSMGVPKYIPYTREHLKPYVDAFVSICGDRKGSTLLMLPSLPCDNEKYDDVRVDTICGAVLNQVIDGLYTNSHQAKFPDGMITSPKELLVQNETLNPRHLRLLFALLDPSVTQIVAPFTWSILELFEYLERNHEMLVENIRNGHIEMEDDISDDFRTLMESKITADPKRADELEKIFSQGFDEPIIPKIWKGMERIVAAGTGDYVIYTEKLRRYTGDSIKMDNAYVIASEGIYGRSCGVNTDQYMLLLNHDFFEFMPAGGQPDDGLYDARDIKVGMDYEVFVTNHAGLYRYRLGDVIHVDDIRDGVPVFRYLRRNYEKCDVSGVTVTINDMYHALKAIDDMTGGVVYDYCMGTDSEVDRFVLYVEPSSVSNAYDKVMSFSQEQLVTAADRALCEQNSSYKEARQNGVIEPVRVMILEPQTQLLYRDYIMYANKNMPDQIKPVRVLDTPKKEKFFRQFAR